MTKDNAEAIIASKELVHDDAVKSFIIKYIIERPKTPDNCPILINKLSKAFPNISKETIAEELTVQIEALYLQGIVSAYASKFYYVRDMTIDLIADCLRCNRMPEWEGSY